MIYNAFQVMTKDWHVMENNENVNGIENLSKKFSLSNM